MIGFVICVVVAPMLLMIEGYEIGKLDGYDKGMEDAIKVFNEMVEEERLRLNERVI